MRQVGKGRAALAIVAVALPLALPLAADDHPPVELPTFAVGDSRVWRAADRGEWRETVTAVEGDLVTWQASNGDVVTTSNNFVLPPVAFEQEAYGSGRSEIMTIQGELFPLVPGKWVDMRFKELGDEEQTRFCTVGDWEQVEVPAGRFEAIKVSCQEVNRSKTWYYAPALGSHVYYLNTHRFDGGVAEELVALERAAP